MANEGSCEYQGDLASFFHGRTCYMLLVLLFRGNSRGLQNVRKVGFLVIYGFEGEKVWSALRLNWRKSEGASKRHL